MYIATRPVEKRAQRDVKGGGAAIANMHNFAINNQHIFLMNRHIMSRWRTILMPPLGIFCKCGS